MAGGLLGTGQITARSSHGRAPWLACGLSSSPSQLRSVDSIRAGVWKAKQGFSATPPDDSFANFVLGNA